MIKKLRRKFILVALLAVFLVLATIVGIADWQSYRSVGEEADRTLALLAENGGRFPERDERPPAEGEPPVNAEGEPPARPDGESRDARLDLEGFSPEIRFQTRYFAVTLTADGSVSATDVANIAAVDEAQAASFATALFAKGKTRGYVGQYRYLAAETGDGATRYIFVDCERELATFYAFLRTGLVISGVGFAVVALLIVVFSGVVVRPVTVAHQKQKRFITDAGHELKTPLTIIGASCEVLELETGENEWTRTIKEQVDRLAALTDKLVFLSRVDEGSTRTVMTDLSLSKLVSEALTPFEAVARAQGKTLASTVAPGLTQHGDASMLRQLVTLLLDNAMKYSVEGGTVTVTLAAAGKNKVLAVRNEARGLPAGDLSALFERFYRTDASRSSETGGHGIGLSVAKAIAELHGGKVAAASPDGRTVTFTVTLP